VRFRGEADMIPQTKPAGSVENDPQRPFLAVAAFRSNLSVKRYPLDISDAARFPACRMRLGI
jgi:hypothetical protein